MWRNGVSPVVVFVARLEPLWVVLLVGGAYGGGLGWRPGAWLMLAAVCGQITGQLVIGTTVYRGVMRRPWPQVAPLTDDDW